MYLRGLLCIVLGLVLVGCGVTPAGMEKKRQATPLYETFVSDATLVSYHRRHGTQIEYHGADGVAYLWYPGNRRLVPSRWKVELIGIGNEICYKYPSSSYNPVTDERGGNWECRGVGDHVYDNDWYEGDPFDLADGQMPGVLPHGQLDVEKLAEILGAELSQQTLRLP
jgi:hypothetical protein